MGRQHELVEDQMYEETGVGVTADFMSTINETH